MIEDNVRIKISNLVARAQPLFSAEIMVRDEAWFRTCMAWIVEALNVVELAIPNPTNAYRRQIEIAAGSGSALERVGTIAAILQSLLPDIDAGLLGNISNKIRAETFDDFLDHAVAHRKENRIQEAGVIAGVVFEDTVRRIYGERIGDHKGRQLEDLINALAKQDVITGQQSKQAKVAAHVRTKATRAQWDEFDVQGVDDTINITRLFLRDHLGGYSSIQAHEPS
jgi:hypothetical protein